MKISLNIVAEIDAQHYPLDTIAELLYALIDDLQERQVKAREDLHLPLTVIKSLDDYPDTGKLTCSIDKAK